MKTAAILFTLMVLFLASSPALRAADVLVVTARAGLTLREKPDINSRRITLIPCGEKVKVIPGKNINRKLTILGDRPGRWTNISYKDREGYAFDGFLSEIEPDEINFIVGEYVMKVRPDEYHPSYLFLYGNGTFRYKVNMCQGFGTLRGTYSVDKGYLRLRTEGADFNLTEKRKIEAVFSIKNDTLHLIKVMPENSYGCDFKASDIFIKK